MSVDDHVDFSEQWSFADVIFIVEDKKLWASKAVLGLWSPVFRVMFSGDFVERNSKEVILPGKEHSSFREFLCITHPPNKEITVKNVCQVLPLLREYQVDKLTAKSEVLLCEESPSLRLYNIAAKYDLHILKTSTLSYLLRSPISLLREQKADWDELDPEFIVELLAKRCEHVESFIGVVNELMLLVKKQTLVRKSQGSRLLCVKCNSQTNQEDFGCCFSCVHNCSLRLVDIFSYLKKAK